ncbi:armadillo-type protein [Gorgonomyces haynaldii]|nr:armadillo-type protein [Gorgonomyces haynaldii]
MSSAVKELNTTEGKNRFKFQSFNDRIKAIKISVHSTKRLDTEESFFIDCLEKWMDRNLTLPYTDFRHSVDQYSGSLAQILHHKKEIVELLGIYLRDPLSAEACMELTASLAMDLQDEFYPHFPVLFHEIVKLVNVQELLQPVFQNIAVLFKSLSKFLVQDIIQLYDLMLPLVGHSKPFIQSFCAESFGFMLRKAKADPKPIYSHILDSCLDKDESFLKGVALLLFESVKQVAGTFFSKAPQMITLLLDLCFSKSDDDLFQSLLSKLYILMGHYAQGDALAPIFEAHLQVLLKTQDPEQLRHILELTSIWIGLRKGSRIHSHEAVLQALLKTCDRVLGQQSLEFVHAKTLGYTLLSCPLQAVLVHGRPSPEASFLLMELLISENLVQKYWQTHTPQSISFLSLLGSHWHSLVEPFPHALKHNYLLKFPQQVYQVTGQAPFERTVDIRSALIQLIADANDLKSCALVTEAAYCLSFVSGDLHAFEASVFAQIQLLQSKFNDQDEIVDGASGAYSSVYSGCAGSLLSSYSQLALKHKHQPQDRLDTVLTLLDTKNPSLLQGVADFLMLLKHKPRVDQVIGSLLDCVGSLESKLRLQAVRVLHQCTQLDLIHNPDSSLQGPCQVFEHIVTLEQIPLEMATSRERPIHLRRIDALVESRQLPQLYKEPIIRFLLAQYAVNFAPYWTEVTKSLAVFAHQEPKVFWTHYRQVFTETSTNTVPLALRFDVTQFEHPEPERGPFVCTNLQQWKRIYDDHLEHLMNPTEDLIHQFSLQDRLDTNNILCLYVKLLSELPFILEQHSKEFVQTFFDLFDDEETEQAKRKILDFLTTFSKVRKPRKLHEHEKLYDLFLKLLANGDEKVQQQALDCILTWQQEAVMKHADHLKNLAKDDLFRDSLATLDLEQLRQSNDTDLVLQIISRILYGKAISRKGRGSSKSGLKPRRIAIFSFVAQLQQQERKWIQELMFAPFKSMMKEMEMEGIQKVEMPPPKQQLGFLAFCEDYLKQLRSLLVPDLPLFLKAFTYMIHYASTESIWRDIRQQALKRLTLLFSFELDFDFQPAAKELFDAYIHSRIDKLHLENTQAPTALLELVNQWTKSIRYHDFLLLNVDLIPNVLKLFSAKNVQETVVKFCLGFVENLQDLDDNHPESKVVERLLKQWMPLLLDQLDHVLEHNTDKRIQIDSIPSRVIRILARASRFVENADNAEHLIRLLMPFLKASHQRVSEQTKTEILEIFGHFMKMMPSLKDTHIFESPYYPLVSQMFLSLNSKQSRTQLVVLFEHMAQIWTELELVHKLVMDLNAFSKRRMDEPDFGKRLDAFSQINQEYHQSLTLEQWRPLIYNLLYFVRDIQEFSVRTSASYGLVRFVERASADKTCYEFMTRDLFASIKNGLKNQPQLVRSELVIVLGTMIERNQSDPIFSDLVGLLGDEESNFFNNIYHMQMHRRMRALRRLGQAAQEGKIRSTHLATIFVPLAAHFVMESDNSVDYNLVTESIGCIALCCSAMSWTHYGACLRRFIAAIEKKPDMEKTLIRLLIQILDQFHFDMKREPTEMDVDPVVPVVAEIPVASAVKTLAVEEEAADDAQEGTQDVEMTTEPAEEAVEEQEELVEEPVDQETAEELAYRVHRAVTKKFIPSLEKLIAAKNDETVPSRAPLAIAITGLLQRLPMESLTLHLPRLLTIVANILSSHLQTARDSARETLVKMSTMLNAPFLSFIVSTLKTCLTRGYMLHVLGHTLHAILDANVQVYTPGSINSCVRPIVDILINDIFGEPGKERQVQEVKNKMRETRTSRSFDSFECLARVISFDAVDLCLLPLKELMLETGDSKDVHKIEQVFARLVVGLNANPSLDTKSFMVFIYQLITETLPLAQPDQKQKRKQTQHEKDITVIMKRNDALEPLKYYEANAHLFVEFGLSLLLTSLRKEKLKLNNVEDLKLLDPMVDLLGRCMYSKHNQVSLYATRILALLVKSSLPSLSKTLPVIMKRVFQIISSHSSIQSETIQSVFRLLTIVFRDVPDAQVSEKQIIILLEMIQPELEEPEFQTTTFALIRAVLSKQFVVLEVYDLMDKIARLLVTSQATQVREMCRQVYIQFLLYYPHGHKRLKKQMAYLTNNLQYEFESGRQSVLELLYVGVKKFSDQVFSEYCDMIFLALVMSVANDESPKCREMAAKLIQQIFKRLDINRSEKQLNLVKKWAESDKQDLKKIGVQVFGLFVETFEQNAFRFVDGWLDPIVSCLEASLDELNQESELDQLEEWELGYLTGVCLTKIIQHCPNALDLDKMTRVWELVVELLLHPQQWVRRVTSQLLGLLFSKVQPETRCLSKSTEPHVLLSSEDDITKICKKLTDQLDSDILSPELATQNVKNLFFLSKTLVPFVNQESERDPGLIWLTKRLVFLARADASKKRGRESVFKWFAAVFTHIPEEKREEILMLMLSVLLRVEKDETLKGEGTVSSHLQKHIGTELFVRCYQKTQDKIQDTRRERKTAKAVQAVADPQASAQRRIQRNEMKKNSKKRKTQEMMLRRGKKSRH